MSETAVAPVETLPAVLAAPHPVAQLRRRVLVTGAGGMLGSDLVPVLAGAGLEVFARPHSDLDITDEDQVQKAFRELRPEIVVNCAAFAKVDACESDRLAFRVNVRGVELLADQCVLHSAQLVQISTDYVFDGGKTTPYLEEDPTGPLSAYGRSKRDGEEAALAVAGALVVRSSWLFGRGGWNFVEAILKQAEGGRRKLFVVNDQRGRPTAATDLSEALLALLLSGAVGTYHFANRGEVTWFDFAREILALSEHSSIEIEPIDSSSLDRPARRPAYTVLDTSKYSRLTGRVIRHFREPLVEYLAARARPEA
jgi:dTDP-4-dehydrorhamnose reductase